MTKIRGLDSLRETNEEHGLCNSIIFSCNIIQFKSRVCVNVLDISEMHFILVSYIAFG